MACRSQPCPYTQLQMPSGGWSPLCYWHRLMRVSMDAQIREADRRLTAVTDPHRVRVLEAEWPSGERWCSGCQNFVPLFYCTGSRCKACSARAARDGHRLRTYGQTPDDHAKLVRAQDGRCAICRNDQRIKAKATDHDHKTGAVRGLLCQRCNHDLLGAAFDSIKILLAAASYLANPPADGSWLDPEVYGDAIMTAFLATIEKLAVERRAAE